MKAHNNMFILSACFSKHATSNERGSISQALQNTAETRENHTTWTAINIQYFVV